MPVAELLVLALALTQAPAVSRDARALPTRNNALVSAGGLLAAGAAYATADDLHDELEDYWLADTPSDVTDVYGASSFNIPVSLGLWTLGTVQQNERLRDLGAGLTRTLTLTQIVVGPIKLAARRRRPDGSNRRSFPSGHTANAFAMARLMQRQYGNRLAFSLYALGGFTAAGRVAGSRHYVSDVIAGAAVGLIIGSSVRVSDRAPADGHSPVKTLTLAPRISPGGGLLQLTLRW